MSGELKRRPAVDMPRVDVGAGVGEKAGNVDVAHEGGGVQRCVGLAVTRFDVGAASGEKDRGRSDVTGLCGEVERRAIVGIANVRVDLRVMFEEQSNEVGVVAGDGDVKETVTGSVSGSVDALRRRRVMLSFQSMQ